MILMEIEAILIMGGKLAAGAGGAVGFWKGAKSAYKAIKGIEGLVEETRESNKMVREQQTAIRVILPQISKLNTDNAAIKESLQKIQYEISPNSGGSMKDVLNSIQDRMDADEYLDPTPIYKCDERGNATSLNKALLEILGMNYAEALGHGWAKQLHDNDRRRVLDAWNEAVGIGKEFDEEYTLINKITGKEITGRDTAIIQRNKDGKVTMIRGVFNPII